MKCADVILHLSLIDGIGPSTLKKIIDAKPAAMSWKELYSLSSTDLQHLFALPSKTTNLICAGLKNFTSLETELHLLEKHKIHHITIFDDEYPPLLRNIHVPPAILYWYGAHPNLFKKNIAIVGARKSDHYGKQVIDQLVPTFVQNNWTIVSGGALGADSFAHQATVDQNGSTIAVFGSGLLHLSPRTHKKLFEQIIQSGGTLLSTFPLQISPRPEFFPMRNRIIAGLSRGCIVVQAAKKSGARITAQFALEQGKEVFAIPGDIVNPLSHGCHLLIQDGAKLVHSIEDVFVEFGEKINIRQPLDKRVKKDKHLLSKQIDLYNENKNISLRPEPVKGRGNKVINSLEQQILALCKQPASIDDVSISIKEPLSKVQELLFELQLEGMVQQEFTGKWVAC